MAGSVFGNIFKISTWGESHGEGLGVVIDGCPAGLPLCEEDIQEQLDRRKPGQSKFTTPRKEDDEVHILSGVFEGKTTGTPISLAVYNKTQRSADYSDRDMLIIRLTRNSDSGITEAVEEVLEEKLSEELQPVQLL